MSGDLFVLLHIEVRMDNGELMDRWKAYSIVDRSDNFGDLDGFCLSYFALFYCTARHFL